MKLYELFLLTVLNSSYYAQCRPVSGAGSPLDTSEDTGGQERGKNDWQSYIDIERQPVPDAPELAGNLSLLPKVAVEGHGGMVFYFLGSDRNIVLNDNHVCKYSSPVDKIVFFGSATFQSVTENVTLYYTCEDDFCCDGFCCTAKRKTRESVGVAFIVILFLSLLAGAVILDRKMMATGT